MKKTTIITLLILILLTILIASPIKNNQPNFTKINNTSDLYYFYAKGCPSCAKMNLFLEQLKQKYPSLNIKKYEINFNQKNRELFQHISNSYNTKIKGVPTIFIGKKVFVGFNNQITKSIEKEIQRCLKQECKITYTTKKNKLKTITIPAVISAAFVDSINPCAFAILIILLSTILTTSSRKRALFAGLALTSSIFISYFLMGLGLYSAIQTLTFTHIFYIIIGVLAILIGLFNLKDYFWYGKWFIMEIPYSWRPKLKMLIKNITSIPGAFLIGFIISLFLLPCTSGPYIIILGLLTNLKTRNLAILLLLLYNLIFILPMLIITLIIYLGLTTTERAEQFRIRRLRTLHLIAGIIMLLLGLIILITTLTNIL